MHTSLASQSDDIQYYITQLGQRARLASRQLAGLSTAAKNNALKHIAQALGQQQNAILAANALDMQSGRDRQLDAALLDRLELTTARFESMLTGLEDVIALADPIGTITDLAYRPSGIQLGKMRVPLGVIAMIYESRPNVTLEAASLAIKSGNAIILRGGSEALHSNQAIAAAIAQGLQAAHLTSDAVQVVNTSDRAAVGHLITLRDSIDVIVPRGGKGLIERITAEARIPVIKHLDGNCHTFVEAQADIDKAERICVNAKTQRYGTCNTMETLLIDQAIAPQVVYRLIHAIACADQTMQFRVCSRTLELIDSDSSLHAQLTLATADDWETEYLAPILAVKIVAGLDEAIEHINQYGSHHTDAIVTENYAKARRFLNEVDSSSVMVNASTRFADGFEYGLGAEIGISTDKIHARGPVGLEGLTSQKWIVLGDGHIRA